MNRITTCEKCGIKYNPDTIINCPICVWHKEEKSFLKRFAQITKEDCKCVSMSRKGKPHKQAFGFHTYNPMEYWKPYDPKLKN